MRRTILTLAIAAVLGLVTASDASACHKRRACATPCAPAPVCVVAAPCPPPAPVCETECAPRKKCFSGFKLFARKNRCATAPAPCANVVEWAAPVHASGQAHGSAQG